MSGFNHLHRTMSPYSGRNDLVWKQLFPRLFPTKTITANSAFFTPMDYLRFAHHSEYSEIPNLSLFEMPSQGSDRSFRLTFKAV